ASIRELVAQGGPYPPGVREEDIPEWLKPASPPPAPAGDPDPPNAQAAAPNQPAGEPGVDRRIEVPFADAPRPPSKKGEGPVGPLRNRPWAACELGRLLDDDGHLIPNYDPRRGTVDAPRPPKAGNLPRGGGSGGSS